MRARVEKALLGIEGEPAVGPDLLHRREEGPRRDVAETQRGDIGQAVKAPAEKRLLIGDPQDS